VTEPAPSSPAPPLRTWRPMVLWSLGILLALGLVWFVASVIVPCYQVRRAIGSLWGGSGRDAVRRLGGREAALAKLRLYRRLPERMAPAKEYLAHLLVECGDRAVPDLEVALNSTDPSTARQSHDALYYTPMEPDAGWTREEVVALASPENRGMALHHYALRSLCRFGSSSAAHIPLLLESLRVEAPMLALSAAFALGEIRDPEAIPGLLAALGRKDLGPAWSVIEALGKFDDPRVVRPLVKAMCPAQTIDPSYHYCMTSAERSLRRILGPDMELLIEVVKAPREARPLRCREQPVTNLCAIEMLLYLLEIRETGPRLFALCMLSGTRDPNMVLPLIGALADNDDLVRGYAAEILGDLGDKRAEEPLQQLLDSPEDWVHKVAIEALGKIHRAETDARP